MRDWWRGGAPSLSRPHGGSLNFFVALQNRFVTPNIKNNNNTIRTDEPTPGIPLALIGDSRADSTHSIPRRFVSTCPRPG
eukprot:3061722-Prymnesium_polylepis.1